MATILETLTSLDVYHLLAWGSLLGMELYQSFLMTKLCYVYLPRPQFTSLQKRVFPVYFALQTTLTAVTAVTYPPNSLLTLAENRVDAALLGAKLAISTFNLFVFGPKTSQLMMKRSHQETRERRNHYVTDADDTITDEMQLLKREFSRNHAMTIHLNLLAIIGTTLYGIRLGSKIA